jgi:hypothetical protein
LLDTYPETFAYVQIHYADAYATFWGDSRAIFYPDSALSCTYFDGTFQYCGEHTYETEFLSRRSVPTEVTIDLRSYHDPNSPAETCPVEATVTNDGAGDKTMRIYMVQVLDDWPAVVPYSRNGLKQAAAIQDITLNPGEFQTVVRSFTFDWESWNNHEDAKIVVWAQEPQDTSPPSDRAEVFQAATIDWTGDLDKDCDVDLDDYDKFVLCFGGPGNTTPLPTCPTIVNADLDKDGDVDMRDFSIYTRNYP